jgi:hypothetical protein
MVRGVGPRFQPTCLADRDPLTLEVKFRCEQ